MINASEAKIKSIAMAANIERENAILEKSATDHWVQKQVPAIEQAIDDAIVNGQRVCHLTFHTMPSPSSQIQIEALITFIQSHHYTVGRTFEYDGQSEYNLTISW
jgi:hypothetical protein